MTNVEALKAVYIAIGGDAADVANAKTTAKVIAKISEIATPGGGGESDFRTCKVTFINNAGKDVIFMMGPYVDSGDVFSAGEVGVLNDETSILDAVLYKQQTNYIELEPSSNIQIEATGDVEVLEDYCDIMGDCTITFSGK